MTTRKHFAKTLGYTCFTMMLVVMLWKGNIDHGMGAGYCAVCIVLFFIGLPALTYEPFSGAAQKEAKAASHGQIPSAPPSHR